MTFDTTTTDAALWAGEFVATFKGAAIGGHGLVDEATMLAWFANAIEAGRNAGRAQHHEIGVLVADNGEFDAYVAFFHDPLALEYAVKRLKAERLDEDREEPDVDVLTITLETVGVADDALLDHLAHLIEEGTGTAIESAAEAAERRAEELADADEEGQPPAISPGQIALLRDMEENDPGQPWNAGGASS